jgi:hypothetical protein
MLLCASVLAVAAGCGSRAPYWNTAVDNSQAPIGLANGVVLVDDVNHRALVLTSATDQSLVSSQVPIGHGFAAAATLADGSETLLLSAGDWPRKTANDQWPSLTIVGVNLKSSEHPAFFQTLEMKQSQPQSTLAVDPYGRYAVAYQGAGSSQAYATNPNEIEIIDLIGPDPAHPTVQPPKQRTIRSFGGTPQRLTFGPRMMLPANAAAAGITPQDRRLLFIETTIDVTIVDLDHAWDKPPRPDITIRLTNGSDATPVTPAGLAIDGAPADGRFALRTKEGSNVYTVQLVPNPQQGQAGGDAGPPETPNDFTPTLNLTDVGGTPTDIAWVNTFQGLRVAALVPTASKAVLLEPDTSVTTAVSLASPYSRMSLVTNIVSPMSTSADVAMLWAENAGAPGIGLWTLGDAVGQPYRSVEVVPVRDPIAAVLDVPSNPDPTTVAQYPQNLKILQTASPGSSAAFYVLNLVDRTASPLLTTGGSPTLAVAPDGERVWAYTAGGTNLAAFDLSNLNPVSLTTEQSIDAVFDVGVPGPLKPSPCGAISPSCPGIPIYRSLIAVHNQGSFGATVFNAKTPDTATSRQSVALLLEGP